MADSNIPCIEPVPLPVTDQQLQPHTNHIVEDQPHVIARKVTLEETIGIERRSDAQSEYIAVKGVKSVARKQDVVKNRTTETIERWVLTRYQIMIDIAMYEIKHKKYPHMMIEGATPVYSPSAFEKCLDCCCSAYSCKWLLSPFKKRQDGLQEEQKEEKDLIPKTESIRRAQTLGVKNIVVSIHNIYTSTPLGSTVREIAVYGGFLWALLFFSISLWGFIKSEIKKNNHDHFFGLFKTIFGAIGMVFLIFDLFYHAYHHRFKTCKEWKQWREQRKIGPENTRLLGGVKDEKEKKDTKQPDSADCCKDKCNCCPKPCSTAFDVGRVFVNEMLYYPILILSIFQFATVVNNNDPRMISVTTWLSNIFSFIGQFVFVYLARAFILAGTVYSVAKIRNKKDLLEGATFQITFVVYTYGLMIIQICMIVAIGTTYCNEYYKLYTNTTYTPVTDINYRLSGELWFMICWAFITPIFGVIMFFVVHHFWTQKFPIEVILDILKVLKKRSIKGTLTSWYDEEINDKISQIVYYLNEEQLHEDFRRIPSGLNRFCDKLTYPFKSPLHIIFCLFYAIMLFTFFICCIVKGPGGGWLFFYFVAFAFGFVVNLYACSVAAVWIVIICIVIPFLFIFRILICCIRCRSSPTINVTVNVNNVSDV